MRKVIVAVVVALGFLGSMASSADGVPRPRPAIEVAVVV